jgi:predicted cupin superfamily sugar epimerase
MTIGFCLYTSVYYLTCNLSAYHKINAQNRLEVKDQEIYAAQENLDGSIESKIRKEVMLGEGLAGGQKKTDDVSMLKNWKGFLLFEGSFVLVMCLEIVWGRIGIHFILFLSKN